MQSSFKKNIILTEEARNKMHITSQTLFQLGGISAVIGGLLRVVFSFIPYQQEVAWLEGFYAVIDVCLLFGLMAIYFRSAEQLGGLGLTAFVISIIGIASLVGPDAIMFSIKFYEVGAITMLIGLSLLSMQLVRCKIHLLAASLWICAFMLGIAASHITIPALILAAGITFSSAFVVSGLELVGLRNRLS